MSYQISCFLFDKSILLSKAQNVNRNIRNKANEMLDINIKAKYNNSIINIRIKANKQSGDEKIKFFYEKYDLIASATCD